MRELEANAQDQYLLTEVLLLEHVDRLIARRLRLPSFQRWKQKHRALRDAQRQPTHWGLDAEHPVVSWTPRLEPGDLALVIGASALPAALLIAAHDVADSGSGPGMLPLVETLDLRFVLRRHQRLFCVG